MFTLMFLGLVALGYGVIHQSQELKACNAELVETEKQNNKLRAQEHKERIDELKQMLVRLNALEQRKRK